MKIKNQDIKINQQEIEELDKEATIQKKTTKLKKIKRQQKSKLKFYQN